MGVLGVIFAVVVFTALVIAAINVFEKDSYEKNQRQQEKENDEFIKKYIEENNIPTDASLFKCINITVNQQDKDINHDLFGWKNGNNIQFMEINEKDDMGNVLIPIENIKFFTRRGDYRVETVTEGGGVSFIKAIVIGLIGAFIGSFIGELVDAINFRIFSSGLSTILAAILFLLGALLGGRRKVITVNNEIDNRKTYLNYIEENENKRIIFASKDYDKLLKLIPDKELSYIENNKVVQTNQIQNDNKGNSIYDDIERLSELKDKCILTEEEFNTKKQLLLDKIQ